MMKCIEPATFSFVLNGGLVGHVVPRKGLR